jgi:hypothetical protein
MNGLALVPAIPALEPSSGEPLAELYDERGDPALDPDADADADERERAWLCSGRDSKGWVARCVGCGGRTVARANGGGLSGGSWVPRAPDKCCARGGSAMREAGTVLAVLEGLGVDAESEAVDERDDFFLASVRARVVDVLREPGER